MDQRIHPFGLMDASAHRTAKSDCLTVSAA